MSGTTHVLHHGNYTVLHYITSVGCSYVRRAVPRLACVPIPHPTAALSAKHDGELIGDGNDRTKAAVLL
jgi:hypothetical protein